MAKKPGFSEHDLEDLTSYLDREVNETELSDWDQRIANDPAARQKQQSFSVPGMRSTCCQTLAPPTTLPSGPPS